MSTEHKSVINAEYTPPTRPYSQDELSDTRSNLQRKLYLGDTLIKHRSCGHSYLVKKGGKKDKECMETGNADCGNCSVCWKLKDIKNKQQRSLAEDMVEYFCSLWEKHEEGVTPSWHEKNDVYNVFYTWLYMENNQTRKKDYKKRDYNNKDADLTNQPSDEMQ